MDGFCPHFPNEQRGLLFLVMITLSLTALHLPILISVISDQMWQLPRQEDTFYKVLYTSKISHTSSLISSRDLQNLESCLPLFRSCVAVYRTMTAATFATGGDWKGYSLPRMVVLTPSECCAHQNPQVAMYQTGFQFTNICHFFAWFFSPPSSTSHFC